MSKQTAPVIHLDGREEFKRIEAAAKKQVEEASKPAPKTAGK